ncbi:MAG: BMP family ABC transporter substrate-binding protein [Nakamurella sp.]
MRSSGRLLSATTIAVTALVLAACGSAPAASPSTGSVTGAATGTAVAASKFLPCVMSDSGGFNDHSFNEQTLNGVKAAASKLGTSFKTAEAKTPTDYTPNLTNLIQQGCSIIVAPSFNLVANVKTAALAHPNVNFAMVDDNSIDLPNVKDIVYATDQAAFLAGYSAAAYTKTGVVALYGGQQIPPVTIFMDGFVDGIAYYNKKNNKDVKALGWDEKAQNGSFIGNFTDQNAAKTTTENELDQNADVIAALASGLYQGTGAAIRSSGKKAVLIGTDSDLFETDTAGYKDLVFTSILKNVQPTVTAVIEQAASEAKFDNAPYIGTLKNGGVGLAPFHDYAENVTSTLADQLKIVTAGIIDGSITVESPSSLTKK